MKHALIALLFVLPICSFAQSNFKKGYVVTNSNDTLRGYVDYRERSVNPNSVHFRSDMSGESKTFKLIDCSGYGVDGFETYRRYTVNISLSKINLADMATELDTTSKREAVFLKILNEGKNVTLSAYRDKVKTRYYLGAGATNEPEELIRNMFTDGPSNLTTQDKFKSQILQAFRKFNRSLPDEKLSRLTYEEGALTKIAAELNGTKVLKSGLARTRFFLGTGLTLSKSSYGGNSIYNGPGAKSNFSAMPTVSGGIDLFANPAIGKLMYRVELSVMGAKNKISVVTGDENQPYREHDFDQVNGTLIPQLIYNVYNTSSLKVFVGAGVAFNFAKYSNNSSSVFYAPTNQTFVLEDFVKFEGFYYSFPVTAGIVLNKRIELSLGYTLPANITNYPVYSISVQRWKFGVNYLFGKR